MLSYEKWKDIMWSGFFVDFSTLFILIVVIFQYTLKLKYKNVERATFFWLNLLLSKCFYGEGCNIVEMTLPVFYKIKQFLA